MTKIRFVLKSSLLGTLVLGAGCSSMAGMSCLKPPAQADIQDHAPLRIPVGLDALDTRAAMKIPDQVEPEAPRGPKAACLENPPPAVFPASKTPAPSAAGNADEKKARRSAPASHGGKSGK